MACLNLTDGLFIDVDPNLQWQSNSQTESAPNGTQIQLENGGANPGITITRGADTEFIPKHGQLHFMRWGTPQNYILVLDVRSSGQRFVTLVDTSGPSGIATTNILFVTEPSAVQLPVVHRSPGNGSLFFFFSPSAGTAVKNIKICRSDNGDVLCSAIPFAPSIELVAEVTATHLKIKDGGTDVKSCTRPATHCDVTPNQHTFPDAVLGAGVDPNLASHTKQFTITNTGTDCLNITGFTNAPPFSVSATSRTLPVELEPSESLTVDVLFAPGAIGNFSEDIGISPAPANGDTVLACVGEARAPSISIAFAGTISFGKVPVGSSSPKTLTISNDGEATVNVNVPSASAGIPFQWASFAGAIAPTASQSIPITFTPAVESSTPHGLTFTSTVPSSPHIVNLKGEGCIANAEMSVQVPPGPYIDFDTIQRGFRTVRVVRVVNSGDGSLNFDASIQGADAGMFGIQQEGTSITSAPSSDSFTINPVSPCGGASGSGEVIFGATFFADDVPGTYSAQLVINNHNAANVPATALTYDLQAEIIPVVNIDVELVLDRSGSMGDPSGERNKSQTAIDAGQLFVQFARPDVDDRIGLVRFNATPEVIPGGFEIQKVTTASQPAIRNGINNTTLNPTGSTSIAGGVRVAVKDIDSHPRATTPPELNTAIVVLTDGHDNTPYSDPDDGVTYSLLGEDGAVPLPSPAGKRLYAVGIGDSIDTARLATLAETTGGQFLHVQEFSGLDFFKLEKHFTQIYMDSVDLAVISDPTFTINPGDTHTHVFDVLQGDTGFMVVIYDRDGIRLPFFLESPLGEVVELTTIPSGFQSRPGVTNTARFLEIGLPEGEPHRYAGAWKVTVAHDGKACYGRGGLINPATSEVDQPWGPGFRPEKCTDFDEPIMYGIALGVGSNFRMTPFVQPGVVHVGEPIALNAVVTEFGLPVTGCNVTVKVEGPDGTTSQHQLIDDGEHGDSEADDGEYGRSFTGTHIEGMYDFTFRAVGFSRDGEPVVREAFRSKYVEGRVPVFPPDGRDGKCCRLMTRLLGAVILLLLVVIVVQIWSAAVS